MDEKKTVASIEVAPTSFPGLFPLKLGKGKALETRLSPAPSQGKRLWYEVRIERGPALGDVRLQ